MTRALVNYATEAGKPTQLHKSKRWLMFICFRVLTSGSDSSDIRLCLRKLLKTDKITLLSSCESDKRLRLEFHHHLCEGKVKNNFGKTISTSNRDSKLNLIIGRMEMDSKKGLQTIKVEPTFDYNLELYQELDLKTEELQLKIEVDVEPSLNLEDQIKLNEENDISPLKLFFPPTKKELIDDSSNSTLYEPLKPMEEYSSRSYIQETNENKPITLSRQNKTNKKISPKCHTNINPNESQYKISNLNVKRRSSPTCCLANTCTEMMVIPANNKTNTFTLMTGHTERRSNGGEFLLEIHEPSTDVSSLKFPTKCSTISVRQVMGHLSCVLRTLICEGVSCGSSEKLSSPHTSAAMFCWSRRRICGNSRNLIKFPIFQPSRVTGHPESIRLIPAMN
uniref:Uncharacterized protein n=1 Tax=Timema genevievae TaxID=629358 RepID=A0A7R9JVS6_TIMGE|nr:unnamed protein product [Timema genevievae]